MLKNYVIAKYIQPDICKDTCLISVPKKIDLEAGDKIVFTTANGERVGVCCCDTFMADPDVICPIFEVKDEYLRTATAKVEYERFTEAREDEEDEQT